MSMKNPLTPAGIPLTPAGIEPATFRFVAQHLNHCATAVLDIRLKRMLNMRGEQEYCRTHCYNVSSIQQLLEGAQFLKLTVWAEGQ